MLLKYLKQQCRECGLPTTGTKSLLTTRLSAHLDTLRPIQNIVSLDLGYQNLAMAHLSAKPKTTSETHHGIKWELKEWRRFSINVPSPICPRRLAQNVKEALEPIRMLNLPPASSVLLVEQQRQRTMGACVLERILLILKIEALIYAYFPNLAFPVLPARVSEHFANEKKCDDQSQVDENKRQRRVNNNNREKKQDAIRLVQSLLDASPNGALDIPDQLKSVFKRERKKDDLADSLLQAWAFSQWHINSLLLQKLRH